MPREYRFWVYILSSKSRRIYTGVTNNIGRRIAQHKAGKIEGFTQQYKINRLVHYEEFQYVEMPSAARKRSRAGRPPSALR